MHGDFSRSTFDKSKHRRLVLRQQGRVDVDADWNEQQAILRHYAETEAADVIGQAGVPLGMPDSFKITPADGTLWIEPGRIYVDGILCENEQRTKLFAQPDLPVTSSTTGGAGPLPTPGQ